MPSVLRTPGYLLTVSGWVVLLLGAAGYLLCAPPYTYCFNPESAQLIWVGILILIAGVPILVARILGGGGPFTMLAEGTVMVFLALFLGELGWLHWHSSLFSPNATQLLFAGVFLLVLGGLFWMSRPVMNPDPNGSPGS